MNSPFLRLWDAKATHVVRRVFKLVVLPVAAALTLFHGVENWRGHRAWSAWKAEQEAAGVTYGLVPPPPVPDADNFAAVPRVRTALLSGNQGKPVLGAFILPPGPTDPGNWQGGHRVDLAAWREALKAPSIEAGLAPGAEALEDLAAASRRTGCRILTADDPSGRSGMLGFRAAGQVLRLRALDRLAANRPGDACEDVITVLRTARHLGRAQNLLGALAENALVNLAMQPIWEGLQDHRWRDADLAALQRELDDLDVLAAMSQAFDHDRREMLQLLQGTVDGGIRRRSGMLAFGSEAPSGLLPGLVIPKGWIQQNMVHIDQAYSRQFASILDPRAHRMHPQRQQEVSHWLDGFVSCSRTPYRVLAGIVVPSLLGQHTRTAEVQVAVDQARVACALERFRLAHKAYPATLAELTPGFLAAVPIDVPAGGPLRYARIEGGYVLHSLGVNGTDEGGKPVLDAKHRRDPAKGDWAWVVGTR